ncbi:MAG: hypothetical protein QOG13_1864 [Sphingomonadales bacterium]|jgi:hypothetical protein|nr:hypothetical protein [Sphingomonadales bacterium]
MAAARGDAAAACAAFERAGFEVGPAVGGTFSITAPRERFEQVFQQELKDEGDAGVTLADPAAGDAYLLPLAGLPDELRRSVSVVTFSPPPAFGPTDY